MLARLSEMQGVEKSLAQPRAADPPEPGKMVRTLG